jgi:hypothetical protein
MEFIDVMRVWLKRKIKRNVIMEETNGERELG